MNPWQLPRKERSKQVGELEKQLANSQKEEMSGEDAQRCGGGRRASLWTHREREEEALAAAEKERSKQVGELEKQLANSQKEAEKTRSDAEKTRSDGRASLWTHREKEEALAAAEKERSKQVGEEEKQLRTARRRRRRLLLRRKKRRRRCGEEEEESKLVDSEREKEEALASCGGRSGPRGGELRRQLAKSQKEAADQATDASARRLRCWKRKSEGEQACADSQERRKRPWHSCREGGARGSRWASCGEAACGRAAEADG